MDAPVEFNIGGVYWRGGTEVLTVDAVVRSPSSSQHGRGGSMVALLVLVL